MISSLKQYGIKNFLLRQTYLLTLQLPIWFHGAWRYPFQRILKRRFIRFTRWLVQLYPEILSSFSTSRLLKGCWLERWSHNSFFRNKHVWLWRVTLGDPLSGGLWKRYDWRSFPGEVAVAADKWYDESWFQIIETKIEIVNINQDII